LSETSPPSPLPLMVPIPYLFISLQRKNLGSNLENYLLYSFCIGIDHLLGLFFFFSCVLVLKVKPFYYHSLLIQYGTCYRTLLPVQYRVLFLKVRLSEADLKREREVTLWERSSIEEDHCYASRCAL
jgi:hypothetical protein